MMKIAILATYLPQQCGIGSFTHSLAEAINNSADEANECFIVAMNNEQEEYNYPSEVKLSVRQELQTDYIKAADFINNSGAEICILQHEFGIFGGVSGVYILTLLHHLNIPVVSTLHTVLETPSYNEKAILQEICKMSEKIVVMSHKAIRFLIDIYKVPKEKIAFIEHGVPDLHFNSIQSKQELKLSKKKVLLTFGFVGRNKGIETALKAMPKIIEKHPEVLYIVLGKTHPNVLRESGEEYRDYLHTLINSLAINNNVLLLNEFADQNALFKYLSACDIYITPYPNVAQITSGTLTYAMGSGCAIVSTPYWHAAELLADNKGRFFDFRDVEGLTKVIIDLLDKPEILKQIQFNASKYGQSITWSKIGKKYVNLLTEVLAQPIKFQSAKTIYFDPLLLPPFSLTHVKRLTDNTGIFQHARFGIPNFKDGYCIDDNARALLLSCMVYKQKELPESLELMTTYLSFIHYMQNEDGSFRNFLSFNRNYMDEVGSDDSFGRTIWALGYLIANSTKDSYYQTGKLIFFKAIPYFKKIKSIRGVALTIIGLCYYLKSHPTDNLIKQNLLDFTDIVVSYYEQNHSENWKWFEALLTYDNAILPLSLLHATQILKDKKVKEIAFTTMNFLTQLTLKDGYLSIIGNENWYRKDEERSVFAQQPLDAQAMVLMFQQAYKITKDREYLKKLFTSFMWFLGENDMRMSLYDYETEGCCDGFEKDGVNRNQGAESTLAYLVAHLTVQQAFKNYNQLNLNESPLSVEKTNSIKPLIKDMKSGKDKTQIFAKK